MTVDYYFLSARRFSRWSLTLKL